MVKLGTIILIGIVILAVLYIQGNNTVKNGIQSIYGTIKDVTSIEHEIAWQDMRGIDGEIYTCTDNQQCAAALQFFGGVTESVAKANTRCFKLRCQYVE